MRTEIEEAIRQMHCPRCGGSTVACCGRHFTNEIERLRAEVESARRDAVALDHAYAGAMAEVEALREALTRLLASVPVAGEIVGTSTVVAYDDYEWAELCDATQQAALAAGRA